MTRISGGLRAWIEEKGDAVTAAFVGSEEATRQPATRQFPTTDDARRWVEAEAAALGLPVEWSGRAA